MLESRLCLCFRRGRIPLRFRLGTSSSRGGMDVASESGRCYVTASCSYMYFVMLLPSSKSRICSIILVLISDMFSIGCIQFPKHRLAVRKGVAQRAETRAFNRHAGSGFAFLYHR